MYIYPLTRTARVPILRAARTGGSCAHRRQLCARQRSDAVTCRGTAGFSHTHARARTYTHTHTHTQTCIYISIYIYVYIYIGICL